MTERTRRITKAKLGVTLVELLVTLVIGLIIMGLTFTIVMANRNLMTRDQVNTELNQNLRIGADIIGDGRPRRGAGHPRSEGQQKTYYDSEQRSHHPQRSS